MQHCVKKCQCSQFRDVSLHLAQPQNHSIFTTEGIANTAVFCMAAWLQQTDSPKNESLLLQDETGSA